VLTETLDVLDMMIHVDARPMHCLFACMRSTASGRSLIEQHRPMSLRVKEAPRAVSAARSRAAVEVNDRYASRRPHLLVVQPMTVADIELANVERLRRLVTHVRKYACTVPRQSPSRNVRDCRYRAEPTHSSAAVGGRFKVLLAQHARRNLAGCNKSPSPCSVSLTPESEHHAMQRDIMSDLCATVSL
jgi:hypothetical protein